MTIVRTDSSACRSFVPWRGVISGILILTACAVGRQAPDLHPRQVVAARDSLSRAALWPGFDPAAVPVAMYDGGHTWLAGYPGIPEGFVPAGDSLLLRYPGRYPLLLANSTMELDGITTATLLLDRQVTNDPAEWAGLVVHEAFHAFQQRRHPGWGPNEAQIFNYPVTDNTLLALRRMETFALSQALRDTAAAGRVCHAWQATQLRARRFSRLDSTSVAYEREAERFEGLADYVESRALGRPVDLAPGGYPPEAVRPRAYASGSAQAQLLDSILPGWQELMEQGDDRSLDELLAEGAARPPQSCSLTVPSPEHYRLAAAAVDSLLLRRSSLRENYLSLPGWTLVLEVAPPGLSVRSFDPLSVVQLNDTEVLHPRAVELTEGRNLFAAFDRAVLTQGTEVHPLFAGVRRVTVAGLASRPSVRDSAGWLLVSGQGLDAAFFGAKLSWGQRMLRLTIESQDDR